MNRILSAISFMSRAYNNSRVINKFIRQIKFIDHAHKKTDDILIVKLEVRKFPFRTQFMTGATFTEVSLSEFSFYIENEILFIRFNDDEIDSISEDFNTFIHINNVYITEKSYLYKKVKRALIPIIKEVKYRDEIHQKMIDFHHKFKDIGITNPPLRGFSSGTSISRNKIRPSSSSSEYSNPSNHLSNNHYSD